MKENKINYSKRTGESHHAEDKETGDYGLTFYESKNAPGWSARLDEIPDSRKFTRQVRSQYKRPHASHCFLSDLSGSVVKINRQVVPGEAFWLCPGVTVRLSFDYNRHHLSHASRCFLNDLCGSVVKINRQAVPGEAFWLCPGVTVRLSFHYNRHHLSHPSHCFLSDLSGKNK